MLFTERYFEALDQADLTALSYGCKELETIHLLIGVLSVEGCEATLVFNASGITVGWVRKLLCDVMASEPVPDPTDFVCEEELPLSRMSEKVMQLADALADAKKVQVDVNHIALALLYKDVLTQTIVEKFCPVAHVCEVLQSCMMIQSDVTKRVNQVTIE